MKTIQQIIKNQTDFGEQIVDYLTKEYKETKKTLKNIESDDNFILSAKNKITKRLDKTDPQKYIDQLFFMHPKRNKVFYAWWDSDEKEVKILRYNER